MNNDIIFVNARFLTQKMTGVQRFAEMLSLALLKNYKNIVFLAPHNILRKDIAKKLNVKIIGGNKGHLWEQIDLPRYLKKNGNPFLLNLCNTAPIFYSNKAITLHDITYIKYPKSYSRKFRLLYHFLVPQIIKRCKHIFTVSEFSRSEISEHFNISNNNISVIYNAVGNIFSPKISKNKDDYILAVSSPNYHKNFHGLIKAVIKNKEFGLNIPLKIIGDKSDVFSAFHDNDNDYENFADIEFLGRVSDDELVCLYQSAKAFVFPSFYEGFGIPPLEAQACGCIVLSSNKASMPEVLRDSAVYFCPNDIVQIADSIRMVINDKELQDTLRERGFENVKRFSWDESAIVMMRVLYEKIFV